jgi:hypothetical protein
MPALVDGLQARKLRFLNVSAALALAGHPAVHAIKRTGSQRTGKRKKGPSS